MSGQQGNPPAFDFPRFAAWLHKWMDSEKLEILDVANPSGLSPGMIHTFRRGSPTASQQRQGQARIAPSLDSMIALAHGLGLQLSYVLSKGGIADTGDRWANFTPAERESIATGLYAIRLYPPGKEGRDQMDLPRLASDSGDMDDLLKVVTPKKKNGDTA